MAMFAVFFFFGLRTCLQRRYQAVPSDSRLRRVLFLSFLWCLIFWVLDLFLVLLFEFDNLVFWVLFCFPFGFHFDFPFGDWVGF